MNLFQHQTVKENFKKKFIPGVADWTELRATRFKRMVYPPNRLLLYRQMVLSATNDVSMLLSTRLRNVLKRQEKKIGKIYYPAAGLSLQKPFHTNSAYDIWICVKSSMFTLLRLNTWQKDSHSLFMRSVIPKGHFKNGRGKIQTTRDLSILRNYAFNKGIKSLSTTCTFTDMTVEVGAPTNVKAV